MSEEDDLVRWFREQPAEHKARLRKIATDVSALNSDVHPVVERLRALQREQRPHGSEWMKWRDAADTVEGMLSSPPEHDFWFNAVRIVSGANMADKEELLSAAKSIEKLAGTGYYDDPKGDELLKQIASYLRGKL